MSKFTITPTSYDSQAPSKDPILNGRIYLCVQIDSGHDSIPCQISGWVRPEVAALVKAAPELLEALRKAEFRLAKLIALNDEEPGIASPDDAVALEQVRSAIAKAEGRSWDVARAAIDAATR